MIIIVTIIIIIMVIVRRSARAGVASRRFESPGQDRLVCTSYFGRWHDTVGHPYRAQISQLELFELILLLKLDKLLPVEQFEATVSQSTVPSPPLNIHVGLLAFSGQCVRPVFTCMCVGVRACDMCVSTCACVCVYVGTSAVLDVAGYSSSKLLIGQGVLMTLVKPRGCRPSEAFAASLR